MDRWGAHPETPLHICFRMWTTIELSVVIDVGKILSLFLGPFLNPLPFAFKYLKILL